VTAGDDLEVPGSPFLCEVYDVDHVYVDTPRRAIVGQLYELQGATSPTTFFLPLTSSDGSSRHTIRSTLHVYTLLGVAVASLVA